MIPLGVLAAAGRAASGPEGGLWTWEELSPVMILDDQVELVLSGASEVEIWGVPGSGLNVFQTVGGYRPQLLPAELNGKRAVRFDGAITRMRRQSSAESKGIFRNRSNAWMFGVHRKRGLDAGTQNRQIFLGYDSGSSTRFGVRAGSGSGGANRLQLVAKRLDSESAGAVSAASAATGTDWYMWLAIMDWTTGVGTLWIDGDLNNSGTVTTSGMTSNTDAVGSDGFPIAVGNNAGGSAGGDVDLAALVCNVDQALATADIDKLFGCAAHRFGLAGRLRADHPYKSSPPGGGGPPPTPTVKSLWVGATT